MIRPCFKPHSDEGIYLPISAILIVALLAVIGYVIDIGTLERTKIQLQKAADAGVIAGLDYRIEKGIPKDAVEIGQIEERTLRFIKHNLEEKGIDTSSSKLTIDPPVYESSDMAADGKESLRVAIHYDTPFLLFPLVPLEMLGVEKTPKSRALDVVAKAIVPRSNILLVLDTSNSMACPTDEADCSCVLNSVGSAGCDLSPTAGSAGNGRAKIYELRRAVWEFLSRFREGRDRIALVGFDLIGTTLVSFDINGPDGSGAPDGIADGFSAAKFVEAIGRDDVDGGALPPGFQPGSLTNTSDALLTAYEELERVKLFGKEKVALVFFTDGAPTAKTGCYSDFNPALIPAKSNGTSCPAAGRRYVDLEVEWVGTDGSRLRGPSPLIERDDVPLEKALRTPTSMFASGGSASPVSWASCSSLDSNPSTYVQASYGTCLNNFSSYLPDSSISQNGEALALYKESYFHRAISVADHLRRNDVIFYTIGVGPASGIDPKVDVYEDRLNDFNRKDGFLLVLANDIPRAEVELKTASGAYPAFPFAGFHDWPSRIADDKSGIDRDGMSLSRYSVEGIADLFARVAHKIQLRFVE